jgi:NTE family protein
LNSNIIVPKLQRALVLQGGGALGAYEVGVIKRLSKKLQETDKKKGTDSRCLFDIVAGTSIGAMNAAVFVSNVVKKNLGPKLQWSLRGFGKKV